MMASETILRIGADHPSLPGHFPGDPIVPGVVLLDAVAEAARTTLGEGRDLVGIPTVKFLSPLRPDEPCRLHLDPAADGSSVRFECRVKTRLVASGSLQLKPA